MHRDVKIGLILGVLLIALVAVLFFRREPIEDLVNLVQPPPSAPPPTTSPQVSALSKFPPPVVIEPAVPSAARPSPSMTPAPINAPNPLGPILTPSAPPPTSSSVAAPLRGITQPVTEGQHLPFRAGDDAPRRTPWEVVPLPAAPNASTSRKHRIQAGDSLWRLAERYLGQGHRADEIYRANRDVLKSPDHLPLGVEIVIPTEATVHSRAASPSQVATSSQRGTDAPPAIVEGGAGRASQGAADAASLIRRYRVKPGDTLRDIARKVFRDEERWRDIFEENRSLLDDPRNLQAGMTIRLPVR